MKLVGWLIATLFWIACALCVVAVPLLGVWLSSSLISYFGGPREAALVAGVLLFPILPLAWEARATSQWKKRVASRRQYGVAPRRSLRTADRILLRVLVLNGAFVLALLGWYPRVAFSALATHGDWFLGARQDQASQRVRADALAAANALEWLHRWANPNPYKKDGDDVPPGPIKPTDEKRGGEAIAERQDGRTEGSAASPGGSTAPANEQAGKDGWRVGATFWPHPESIHPVVAAMQAQDEGSIEAVARHIAAREQDPFQRVKALHDWVVTRLRYDHEALRTGQFPPQDAHSAFATRVAVCEGYARLLTELGKQAGEEIAFVVGEVRKKDGDPSDAGHAWNAAKIQGDWYILDATWDDPTEDGDLGAKQGPYRTDYLFIPPSVAISDHFPDDERWQLLSAPLSRGDFLRQPFATPQLAREGLRLVVPERSAIDVDEWVVLRVENPRNRHLLASLASGDGDKGVHCAESHETWAHLRCKVPAPGRYEARLFSNVERYGAYGHVATIEVTRR